MFKLGPWEIITLVIIFGLPAWLVVSKIAFTTRAERLVITMNVDYQRCKQKYPSYDEMAIWKEVLNIRGYRNVDKMDEALTEDIRNHEIAISVIAHAISEECGDNIAMNFLAHCSDGRSIESWKQRG